MPINCSISFNINIHYFGCTFVNYSEQKARATYENLINLTDDPDVIGPLLFLRQREIIHFARFKELFDEYKSKGIK